MKMASSGHETSLQGLACLPSVPLVQPLNPWSLRAPSLPPPCLLLSLAGKGLLSFYLSGLLLAFLIWPLDASFYQLPTTLPGPTSGLLLPPPLCPVVLQLVDGCLLMGQTAGEAHPPPPVIHHPFQTGCLIFWSCFQKCFNATQAPMGHLQGIFIYCLAWIFCWIGLYTHGEGDSQPASQSETI